MQFDATWNGGVEQEILHPLRAFQVEGGRIWRKAMSRVEGMRETGSVVGGGCDFHLERACGSGIVLFKMGVPGGSNLTLPGTAEWNRRFSIHCGRSRWMTGIRMGQMESERAGWMTDGSSRMWNGVPGG